MYGAPRVFSANRASDYLMSRSPNVLRLEAEARHVELNVGNFSGPASLGTPATARPMRVFNPSITRAPRRLCPRCAWLFAVRVDPLHQCDSTSPLFARSSPQVAANAYFKNTAIVVADEEMRTVGWTWLLASPENQVSSSPNTSRWRVPVGVADGFAPPWANGVYDARLFNFDERLFVTFLCNGCMFSLSLVQLTCDVGRDGESRRLRAWVSHRFVDRSEWAQGRNQALFAARRRSGGPNELFVQTWLNVIASVGSPRFARTRVACPSPTGGAYGRRICAHNPQDVVVDTIEKTHRRDRPFGSLTLVRRESRFRVEHGHRLSTTSNLIPLRASQDSNCTVLLGVGHIHRKQGKRLGRVFTRASSTAAFMWGGHYTHFFYALSVAPPFRMLAMSAEFCISSRQDPSDCESVQFVAGLGETGPDVLLSYGINDCEAKVAAVRRERVWRMLEPLSPERVRSTGCEGVVWQGARHSAGEAPPSKKDAPA